MTGPLLSSKESSAEKRNYLLSYVEDQAAEGVYKTELKNDTVVDVATKDKKLVQHVNIIEVKKVVQRQEESLFKKFHVHISNLSLNSIDYDEGVEAQIKVQQRASMDVQTAMANSKKAEQDAVTIEFQGKASAAKAKWDQEVIKSTAVTKAEQEKEVAITNAEREKEVARLASVQAGFYKTQQILEGQGDAEKKRLSTASNNNLEYKVDAWVKVNVAYAEAMKSSSWVPTTVIGGGSGAPGMGDAGQALINMLMVKTAKDLNIPATPTK
jgi:regulator of protease activity HflC (stomatin/prohibitin superfamily)